MAIFVFTQNTAAQNATPDTLVADGEDIAIREESPNFNFDGDADLALGNSADEQNNALFSFDEITTNISATDTINSATLYINQGGGGFGSFGINTHGLLRAWVRTQATYNDFSTGNSWATPGALSDGIDRQAAVDGSATIDSAGGYVAIDVTDIVSDIADGTIANNGILVQPVPLDGPGAFRFCRRYTGTDGERPELVVDAVPSAGETVTESHSVSDAVAANVIVSLNLIEALSFNDVVSDSTGILASVSEGVVIEDSNTAAVLVSAASIESFNFNDSIIYEGPGVANEFVGESISFDAINSSSLNAIELIVDSLDFSESITVGDSAVSIKRDAVGFNLLRASQQLLTPSTIVLRRFSRTSTNESGYDVQAYEQGVAVRANIQPVDESSYKQLGLDFAKEYIYVHSITSISGLSRISSGDRIDICGHTWQVRPERANWFVGGLWNSVIAVKIT